MKKFSPWGVLVSVAIGACIASTALGDADSYFYIGAGAGQSRARIDVDRVTNDLLHSGFTTTALTRDEKHFAYKAFAGYQFNPYIALEAGYFNLGKFGYIATTVPAGTLHGRIKLQGGNVDLVGSVPIAGGLSAIARVGGIYTDAQDNFSGTGADIVLNPNPKEHKAGYKFGGGLQYAINRTFLTRIEAERYRVPDGVGNRGDVNMFSVSLLIAFGRPTPPPPAKEPPPYVPPPPPPPVVVPPPPPPPPPPARRRVSFQADSLFTFDKSNVRPEGKAALDKFAKEMVGTSFQTITVEGHTDRLGSDEYNQRLSERRAEEVKTYLVTSAGIDAAKISTVGKGESAPVTKPGECVGEKRTPRLIACLQPDRRVEIEVTGTQAP